MTYRAQLHTHTWRCKHAEGDVIDYARIAAEGGCEVLGISDHMPHPDGRWSDVRMAIDDLPIYEAAIDAARVAVPKLRIITGMECEWLPELASFYADELKGRRGYGYLIGAGHYIEVGGKWRGSFGGVSNASDMRIYADLLIDMMESGHFAFIAHPDCIGAGIEHFDTDLVAATRDIAQAAVATGTPLELNAYGLRKPWRDDASGPRPGYPWEPFWSVVAEVGAKVVLSSDAHRPQDVLHGHAELCALRDRYGLEEVDPIGLIETCASGRVHHDAPP